MAIRVLVVRSDPKAGDRTQDSLLAAGYHVSRASDFEEAKMRLLYAPPDVLVTDVRLGTHNGVHLLVYAHATHPTMPGIVLDAVQDRVIEKEVTNEGGVYVTGDSVDQDILMLVSTLTKTLEPKPSASVRREFPRTHAELPVTAAGASAKIVDVSYRGLRLEMPGRPDHTFEQLTAVNIPSVGTLSVRPVWARGAPSMPVWWCGVEVMSGDAGTVDAWRDLVDSLGKPAVQKSLNS